MLLAVYFFIVNVVIPQLGAFTNALIEPVMIIVITLAGITMLFGAVGMRISNNLGATIVGGILRGIGYVCRTIINAIGWILRNTFRMIPRVFNGSRQVFNQMGMSTVVSNILAIIAVVIFIAIII